MNRNCPVARIALAVSLLAVGSARCGAGELFASGDSNFLDALNGTTNGAAVDAGNRQFVLNVLSGGGAVVLLDTTTPFLQDTAEAARDYLNTEPGITATIISGTITQSALAGADLFVVIAPDDDFSATENAAMRNFMLSGGNIILTGENAEPTYFTVNSSVNAALQGIGSSLVLAPAFIDTGFNQATILSDPFTTGVNTFSYAYASRIIGGTPLFNASQGTTFLARETIVPEPTFFAILATGTIVSVLRVKRRR